MIGQEHKKSMKAFENNCSLSLTNLLTSECELDKIATVECLLACHGIKHGHSYRSQACTVDLIRNVFESSALAKSISCGKTKARAITCNALGPFFTDKVIDEVLKAEYCSLSVDASNKRNCKMYPLAVQYFSEIGVHRGNDSVVIEILYLMLYLNKFHFDSEGLIEFINDPRESAIDIFKNICKIIDDNKLRIENLISYGADNTNVNFGEHHSVFLLLKSKVPHLVKGKYIRLLNIYFYSNSTFCIYIHNATVIVIFFIMQCTRNMTSYQLILKQSYVNYILISRDPLNELKT